MIYAPSNEAWCSTSRACPHTAPPRPVQGLSRLYAAGMPHHANMLRASAAMPHRKRQWRAQANADERAGQTVAPEPLAGPEGAALGPQDDLWIHTGLVLLLGGLMPSLVGTQFLDEVHPLPRSPRFRVCFTTVYDVRHRSQTPRQSLGIKSMHIHRRVDCACRCCPGNTSRVWSCVCP